MLNIEAEFAKQEAKHISDRIEADLVSLMVAPAMSELPNDGILDYEAAVSVYDFKSFKAGTVVMVSPENFDMLQVVVDNQTLFRVHLSVLVGLPGADYAIPFEQVVWSLEKVAYAPLVSELALSAEIEHQDKLNKETQHDAERRRVTRADGSIKEHTTYDVAESDDIAVTDDGSHS